jgi:hypothetical protein
MSAAQSRVTIAMGGQCFAVEPEVRPWIEHVVAVRVPRAPMLPAGVLNCGTAVQFRG